MNRLKTIVTYFIIHKWENEHKCLSVRDDESDSAKVRLWLCRIFDTGPDCGVGTDEDTIDVEFIDAVLEFVVIDDEFVFVDVRLLLLLFSIVFCFSINIISY